MALLVNRRTILILAVGLAFVAWELWPRDERRIVASLNELCSELNRTRDEASLRSLQATLRVALLPSIRVTAPEIGGDLRRSQAVIARSRELLLGPPLSFSLADPAVRVNGAVAHVTGNLIVTVSGSGEQHRDLRYTEIELEKSGAEWRIARVNVDRVRPDQPEARP